MLTWSTLAHRCERPICPPARAKRRRSSMEQHPVLWHFTFSHFNEKARWALDYKGIRHVRHPLVPGFHASTVRRMTGQTAMPVLQMNGRTIHDSTRIIAALEEASPE